MTARATALLLLLLALAAGGASAAADCSRIVGCSSCSYELDKDSASVLVCKACGQGYALKDTKNLCACAPGYTARDADGTALGRCIPAPAGSVSAGGAVTAAATVSRVCLSNSKPNAAGTACLCDPGFYVLVGGQTPRCSACAGNTYLDAPNTRHACKPCGAARTANGDHTACVDLVTALTSKAAAELANVTGAVNSTLAGIAGRANGTLTTVLDRVNDTWTAVTDRVTAPWTAVTDFAANVTDHPLQTLEGLLPGDASISSSAASGRFNLTATQERLSKITSRLNPLAKAKLEKLVDLSTTDPTKRAQAMQFLDTVDTVVKRGTTILAVVKILSMILGGAGLG